MPGGHESAADDAIDPAEALFLEAIERAPHEREAWVLGRSDADDAVREAAIRMLRALGSSSERVDSALGQLRREVVRAVDAGDGSAGRYVLLQPIGSGAFGDVFVGVQEHPVRRLVAVKVLSDTIGSAAAAARFRLEQQAIASLDHPGIAPLLDAGTRSDGRPWFAMPFIAGLAITRFAEERGLGLRARIELACATCDAVEHAHRRGVIHRDLKPANVLVDDASASARPRVIDFGVAKLADASFEASGQRTMQGELLGTPEYMAPEQAEGGVPDTRFDAFSLGVILYELVARQLPRASDRLRAGGRSALAGTIRSMRPIAPSRVAGACGGIDDGLDAICLRAVAADSEDRYASVSALHEDLRRWLAGEDPLALRPSRARSVARWVRRHRGFAGSIMAVALALVAATVLSLRAADAARAAERRADRRAQQNARVMAYLADVIRGADPTQQDGRVDMTVRETLGRAVADLDAGALEDAPAERAEIRLVLGDAFSGLGLVDEALREYGQGLDALASADPPAPALECMIAIQASALLANVRRGTESVAFAERALSASARSPDAVRDRARALSSLGEALRSEGADLGRARAVLEESVSSLRQIRTAREDLAAALNNLGIVLMDQGELDDARASLEEAVRINESLGAAGGYRAMFELHNLAQAERAAGRLDDAERHARQALALVERFAGKDHPNRASVLGNLALVMRARKEFAEGETVQREALRVLEASGSGEGADAGIAWLNIASFCRDQAKVEEAVGAGARAVGILERVPEVDPWLLAAARMAYGRALMAGRRWREAEGPLLAAWSAVEPLEIDARRKSAALLAAFQLYRDWAAADAAAVRAEDLESWRSRVRAFDAAHPGVIPEGAY